MYGLFFLLCLTGQSECYDFIGTVYPDEANCLADIREHSLPETYTCLPVDAVVRQAP